MPAFHNDVIVSRLDGNGFLYLVHLANLNLRDDGTLGDLEYEVASTLNGRSNGIHHNRCTRRNNGLVRNSLFTVNGGSSNGFVLKIDLLFVFRVVFLLL